MIAILIEFWRPGPGFSLAGVGALDTLDDRVRPNGDERIHRDGRDGSHGPADNRILQLVRQDDRATEPYDEGKTGGHNNHGTRRTSNVVHDTPSPAYAK
jgi:hypothetical protein